MFINHLPTGKGVSTVIRTVVKTFVMYLTTIRKQEKDLKDLEGHTNLKE